MITTNQLKLIVLVLIIIIIAFNQKYFGWLNGLYKTIKRIPKTVTIILTILAIVSLNYNTLKGFMPGSKTEGFTSSTQVDGSAAPSGPSGGLNINTILQNNVDWDTVNDISSLSGLFGFKVPQTIAPKMPSMNNTSVQSEPSEQKVKRKVRESTKKLVAARQKWRCGLCHKMLDETFEVDHVIPLHKGGTNHPKNLMPSQKN